MSEKIWADEAWEDYLYWQTQDKKTLKRINLLVKDIERNGPLSGIGNPEALRDNLHGFCSCRIDEKNRLVYKIESGSHIYIAQCKGHYNDKQKFSTTLRQYRLSVFFPNVHRSVIENNKYLCINRLLHMPNP